jgi:hypothetical protein
MYVDFTSLCGNKADLQTSASLIGWSRDPECHRFCLELLCFKNRPIPKASSTGRLPVKELLDVTTTTGEMKWRWP